MALLTLWLVGIGGVWQLGKAQSRFNYVQSSLVPKFKDMYAMRDAVGQMRVVVLRSALDGPAHAADYDQQLAVIDKRFDDLLQRYAADAAPQGDDHVLGVEEEAQSAQRDQALTEADKTALQRYRDVRRQYLDRAHAGGGPATDAAFATLGVAGGVLTKAIDDHLAFNLQLSDTLDAIGQSAYGESRDILLVILAAATAGLLLIGLRMLHVIRQRLGNMQHIMERVDQSLDLTARATVQQMDEVGHTATAFNHLLSRLQANMRAILDGAHEVTLAAQQLAQTSGEVSRSAAAQSESSSSMAATVEQLTASINHVSLRAQETLQQSNAAGERAQAGSGTISQTIDDIRSISQSVSDAAGSIRELENDSAQVETVVQVISDIADQTNLLALNAAIEAARAGEAGRGFAVVADEVRKLAERTTKSTREIAGTIEVMRQRSQHATALMQTAEERVTHGVTRADSADQAIRAIGEATQHAATHVGEISVAIEQQGSASNNIAVQIERIAQMAEEASAAAQSSSAQAGRMDQLAARLAQMLRQYRL